jgi:L-lactate dehydrogenase (cytochrome)
VDSFARLLTNQIGRDVARWKSRPPLPWRTESRLRRCRNVADVRELARRRLPQAVFDFVDGAANDELTAARNRRDLDAVDLLPRHLVGVGAPDPSTTVFGTPIATPLLGAPTGLTGMVHHHGEIALARACERAGSLYILSCMGSFSLEEVAAAAPGTKWFQLYMFRDRGLVRDLVERAGVAGYQALVVTVDVPVSGIRERDVRNGFGVPPRITARSLAQGVTTPRWSWWFLRDPRTTAAVTADRSGDVAELATYATSLYDPSITWKDLEELRAIWDGPLVVKGILHPEDARRAVACGADGLIVSNHGGRQLDGAPSSIRCLPWVVDAVDESTTVLLDSGVRRGADVIRAMALGATACVAGRSLIYGLAAGGEQGARRVLDLLDREVRLAMALTGARSIAEVGRDSIVLDDLDAPRRAGFRPQFGTNASGARG